ncbi:MAG: ERF family protein [Paracoccaceae bacterium]
MSEQLPADNGSLLSAITRAAADPAIDVDKMMKLSEMYERLEGQRAQREYNAAMAEVQAEMQHVVKDATNPQTRSKYATYAALDAALRPIYAHHGFSVSFDTAEAKEGHLGVVCLIGHRSGHTKSYRADIPVSTTGLQGKANMTLTHATGSAMTYGRRYLLEMAFNIVRSDDDGNAAGGSISQDQHDELLALLGETGADHGKFLAYFKIPSLDRLPAKDLDRAMKLLDQKRAK